MKPEPRLEKRAVRKADGRYLIYYERKPAEGKPADERRRTEERA